MLQIKLLCSNSVAELWNTAFSNLIHSLTKPNCGSARNSPKKARCPSIIFYYCKEDLKNHISGFQCFVDTQSHTASWTQKPSSSDTCVKANRIASNSKPNRHNTFFFLKTGSKKFFLWVSKLIDIWRHRTLYAIRTHAF